MLARGYLDERACKSSFVQIRREFGHHGVTIFNIGILQMGTYLPMPQSYAGWAIPPGCYGMSVALGYMYGPSPDCKRKLLDSGSGLLLCIRLLSGAVLLLRAMMESAPSLSSLP